MLPERRLEELVEQVGFSSCVVSFGRLPSASGCAGAGPLVLGSVWCLCDSLLSPQHVARPTSVQQQLLLQAMHALQTPKPSLHHAPHSFLQALVAQITGCRFHNFPDARPSLLSDYACGTEQIPTCTTQARGDCSWPVLRGGGGSPVNAAVGRGSHAFSRGPWFTGKPWFIDKARCCHSLQVLLDHTDEVWHLAFSHNGRMLASCGKDQTAIIWDVERRGQPGSGSGSPGGSSSGGGGGSIGAGSGKGSAVVRRHVLRGHSGPIAFLCWSPDDSKLATCGETKFGGCMWQGQEELSRHCIPAVPCTIENFAVLLRRKQYTVQCRAPCAQRHQPRR